MSETTTEAPALPGDGLRESIVDELRRHIGDGMVEFLLKPQDDLWIRVAADTWAAAGRALQSMGFEYFCFLSGIDWKPSPFGRGEDDPTQPPPERKTEIVQGYAGGDTRFQVFARVTDIRRHVGVTLKVDIDDGALALDSWHAIYAGANWHERETHEMYGISFTGHPDLRNMYLPTEFEGYPLRKDFPLLARHVKPWPGIVDVEPMPAEGVADAPVGDAAPVADTPVVEEAPQAEVSAGAGADAAAADRAEPVADAVSDSVSPDPTDSVDPAHTEPEVAPEPGVTGTADEVEAIADAVADESRAADEAAVVADSAEVEAVTLPDTAPAPAPAQDEAAPAGATEAATPESDVAEHPESAAEPAEVTDETVEDAPEHTDPETPAEVEQPEEGTS